MILGFIGTGKISSSIIFGIFKSKLKIKRIYISSRNRNIAKKQILQHLASSIMKEDNNLMVYNPHLKLMQDIFQEMNFD